MLTSRRASKTLTAGFAIVPASSERSPDANTPRGSSRSISPRIDGRADGRTDGRTDRGGGPGALARPQRGTERPSRYRGSLRHAPGLPGAGRQGRRHRLPGLWREPLLRVGTVEGEPRAPDQDG